MNTPMKRMVEKFIMIEFFSNRLNTQEEVDDMITLVENKLGMFPWEARSFVRQSIGLCKK